MRGIWELVSIEVQSMSCGGYPFYAHSNIYYILKDEGFKSLGAEYYSQFNKERKINVYLKS